MRDFIHGKRVKYTLPLAMVFLMTAFYMLTAKLIVPEIWERKEEKTSEQIETLRMKAEKLQQTIFELGGRPDIRVGTVEGWPALAEVRRSLEQMRVRRVHLAPLMLVAGDHARNDMAGEGPDSWKTILEQDGYAVTATLEGLGRCEAVQALYAAHLREDLTRD